MVLVKIKRTRRRTKRKQKKQKECPMLTSKQMTLPDDLKKKIMAAKKKKPGSLIQEANSKYFV